MDIKKYGEEVIAHIDAMSDEEFNKLLEEAGLEECPYLEDIIFIRMKSVYSKYPKIRNYNIDPKIYTPRIQELIRLSLSDED